MRKIVILTDSTADIDQDLLDEKNVFSLPHYIRFGNNIYQDGLNLNGDDLYGTIKEKKSDRPLLRRVFPILSSFMSIILSLIMIFYILG